MHGVGKVCVRVCLWREVYVVAASEGPGSGVESTGTPSAGCLCVVLGHRDASA